MPKTTPQHTTSRCTACVPGALELDADPVQVDWRARLHPSIRARISSGASSAANEQLVENSLTDAATAAPRAIDGRTGAASPAERCARRRHRSAHRRWLGARLALLAQVLVSKYCDHTPLYRQSQIFARLGVDLDRSTLAGWVGGACWWLDALHEKLCANVFASDHLFADDTPVPVLDPGRGRTKTGRLWVYARDQRPWGGPSAPAAIFVFAPDRKSERPAAHLEQFSGVLHVDGYAGFERFRSSAATSSWPPVGRIRGATSTNSSRQMARPLRLRRCGELVSFMPSRRASAVSPPRSEWPSGGTFSKPLVEKLKVWLEQQLSRAPRRGKLADAIRYALSRWDGLTRFLHDGRIELDTNPVERAIRPVALGRKN